MPLATRWAARAMYQAWKAGVGHFFWFSLRDEPRGARFDESVQSGLYLRGPTLAEDRPKKLLRAFRFPFVALPARGGFSFWGRTPTSTGGGVTIEVRRGAGWRTVTTGGADASGIFAGRVRTGLVHGRSGLVRARYRGQVAVPFSLRETMDFYQPPFG
jgi:hypothetical protein